MISKECPRCHVKATGTKDIREIFGFRTMKKGKKPIPQSYCRACRTENGAEQREKARADQQVTVQMLPQVITHVKPNGHTTPAPVPLPTLADKQVAVRYGSRPHAPGDLVVLGASSSLYRVGSNGSITAVQ